MKKNKRMFIIIPTIIISFLLILFGISQIGKNSSSITDNNQYRVSDTVVELDGTKIIKNQQLTDGHCLDDICVKDLVVYDLNGEGRIEYTISNNGSSEASDFLKLNFGNSYIYIHYSALQPGRSVKSRTIYRSGDFTNINDFTIEKLTAEELNKINVH